MYEANRISRGVADPYVGITLDVVTQSGLMSRTNRYRACVARVRAFDENVAARSSDVMLGPVQRTPAKPAPARYS